MLNNISSKFCRFKDNVERYDRARQTPDDNIMRHRPDSIWMLGNKGKKNTDTRSEYLILITLPWQQWLCELACVALYPHCMSR